MVKRRNWSHPALRGSADVRSLSRGDEHAVDHEGETSDSSLTGNRGTTTMTF